MRTATYPVKSKSKVVGEATYKIYDSVAEALADLGELALCEVINSQIKTNEMNRVRGLATGQPSKKWLRDRALEEIPADVWPQIAGDSAKIAMEIEKRMAIIAERMQLAPASPEDEDNE